MLKFKVGDLVLLKDRKGKVYGDTPFEVLLCREGDYYNWYRLSNGFNYKEELLELVHPKPPEIVAFYLVENIEFDNLDEAKKHLKKVQLFGLLSKGLDDDSKNILESLLDPIIQNSNEIIDILK